MIVDPTPYEHFSEYLKRGRSHKIALFIELNSLVPSPYPDGCPIKELQFEHPFLPTFLILCKVQEPGLSYPFFFRTSLFLTSRQQLLCYCAIKFEIRVAVSRFCRVSHSLTGERVCAMRRRSSEFRTPQRLSLLNLRCICYAYLSESRIKTCPLLLQTQFIIFFSAIESAASQISRKVSRSQRVSFSIGFSHGFSSKMPRYLGTTTKIIHWRVYSYCSTLILWTFGH